jgi:Type IX secretion system protein PorV
MKRWLLIPCFISRLAWAADPGTTAANFLKLGVGPRAIGMGEAQVGVADDAYATWWNPAGLVQVENPEISATYNNYLGNTAQQYIAGVLPEGRLGTFGGSANVFTYGTIAGADAAGQPISNVSASDLALAASFAHPIFEDRRKESHLSFGVTGKWIREKLDTVAADALAMDAGFHWEAGKSMGEELEGLRAGLVVRNLGSSMKFDTESFALPRTAAAGVALTRLWRGESMTFAVDGEKPQAGSGFFSGGVEVWTLRTFVIRGGYTARGDVGNGLRLGAGIRFQTLEVDYAFANEGDLGSAHRVGISFQFGKTTPEPLVIAETWYEKGVKEYRRAHYTDALVDFNKALEIDPNHPDALAMMQKTYERIKATGAGDLHD